MTHSRLKTIVVIAVGLLLGFVIAGQLNAFLGISFTPKDLPQEAVYTLGPPLQPAAPLAPVAAIVLPVGALQDELYTRAAADLAVRFDARSGRRPAIVDSPAAAPAGRSSSAQPTRPMEQLRDYVQRAFAYGINGIVIPSSLELIDFDCVGDGYDLYPAGSDYRARSAALCGHFGRLFDYADAMGREVILYTDMLVLTPPLQAYLGERFGGLDAENPELWEVCCWRAGR